MDNKHTEEYLKKWKDVKLSDSSRQRIEGALKEYAEFHPVRVPEGSRSMSEAQGASFISRLFTIKVRHMTAALLIAVLIGGGTTYAAEGAVPGDLLYPVKVEVNENVKSAFALSNEAEAELQARLAKERLEEAEELAARGELQGDAAADLRTRLQAHYENAEMRSGRAAADGNIETSAAVRASLEGTFRTYADILEELNVRVVGNDSATLITDMRGYADATARTQATATADVSADASVDVEATLKRAESMIDAVKAKLERARGEISAEAYARIEANVNEGARLHADAVAKFRSELYREAYQSAQSAIRIANQVDAMIASALRLELDLDLGGVIDTRVGASGDSSTDTNTDTDTRDQDRDTDSQTDTGADVEVDADANVDADIIDANVETETRGGVRLNI